MVQCPIVGPVVPGPEVPIVGPVGGAVVLTGWVVGCDVGPGACVVPWGAVVALGVAGVDDAPPEAGGSAPASVVGPSPLAGGIAPESLPESEGLAETGGRAPSAVVAAAAPVSLVTCAGCCAEGLLHAMQARTTTTAVAAALAWMRFPLDTMDATLTSGASGRGGPVLPR